MYKKDKGQTQATQWTKKTKGQTQAIQWTKKKKNKHRQHNGQERQSTNTGDTMDKKDKGQTQATQ
jgi:hypothetical protein